MLNSNNKAAFSYEKKMVISEAENVPKYIRDNHIVFDPHEGGERMTDIYNEANWNEEDSASIIEIL
jgi:hypothetical protein